MDHNFSDFPCNKCGWCCQRTPCPMGLYLGQKPMSSCSFLKETSPDQFECGLILEEKDLLKKEALKELMLAGTGCSHIYGPSPLSLMRQLVAQGLMPSHPDWQLAIENTLNEYQSMTQSANDPESIENAISKFQDYCQKLENSF